MDSSAKLLTESKRNSLRKAILSLLSEWRHFDKQLASMNPSVESREGILVSVHESGTKELTELENMQFEPIRELIGEKMKKIDSKKAYFENRAKELDLVEDSIKRRAQLLDTKEERIEERVRLFDLKEKELQIREGGLDFAQNFIQERAKELEAQQKLIHERVRELELKEKQFINVKTEQSLDNSKNEGSQGTLPRSNVGKSSTAAITSGSNQDQFVFCQQEDVPTGEAVKVGSVISERILVSHLRPEVDSNNSQGSDPVMMAGGAVEIGRSLKNKKEVGHANTEDGNVGVGMPKFRELGTSRNTNRKRERKLGEVYDFMNSSKKSCKRKLSTDGKQEQTPEPLQAKKLKVGNSAGVPVAANADEENVKQKGSASTNPVLLYENGEAGKHQVNVEEAVTLNLNAKKANVVDDSEYTFNLFNRSDPALYDYPDPEFSNFVKDKEERCFSAHQIWAVYDTIDSMPRFYAEIMKVLSPGFKLLINWLDADPEDQGEIEWVDNGISVACGKFKRSTSEETSDRLMFSHQIRFERGSSRGYCRIYPRKGETWALFKDWDIRWRSDPENHKNYIFEMVEILTGHVHDAGIRIVYLEKIKGFVSLFQRRKRGKVGSFLIPPSELLRFSHQIPSFKMTGTEREGVPEGSFELDPAALPVDLFKSPGVCPSFSEVFSKFDREKFKNKFQPGQIWALYSCKDGMPKTYAQIKKIESSPFKLHAALLEPCSRRMQPVCCGIFEVQHNKTAIFPSSSFSHEVKVKSVCKNIYGIYPREGEIWAIYKHWNAELSFSDMENCEYEIVEILENKDCCIEVSCLVPLTGVKWTFMAPRRQISNIDSLEIRQGELARFSHQIPSIQLIGQNHCWELDPASVPGDMFRSRSCRIERSRKRPR